MAHTVNFLFETLKPQEILYLIHVKISPLSQLKEIANVIQIPVMPSILTRTTMFNIGRKIIIIINNSFGRV